MGHDDIDAEDVPRVRSVDNGTLEAFGKKVTIPRFPGQSSRAYALPRPLLQSCIYAFYSPPARRALSTRLPTLATHSALTLSRYFAVEDGLDFLDTKLPRIRGQPAFRELAMNLKPGITVSLVSLPLSISLAIASGCSPVQGIITACWAGIVSALTGGSHYNVVGPTGAYIFAIREWASSPGERTHSARLLPHVPAGALSGILSYFSVTYGPGIQPLLAVMTGIFCLLVWLSQIDKYLVFIPGAVMHGFTMGVAFIISANQINFALGLPKLTRHPEFVSNLYESINNAGKASVSAIAFFVIGLSALLMLSKRYGKIPWAVVLAFIGIIIGGAADAAGSAVPQTIKTQYGDLQLTLVQVSVVFTQGLPNAGLEVWYDLLRGAISITAVAVLETLISARIADRMTKTIFNQRQEVMSVGLANLASGLTGGIPATAALARTALNIKSGASSRAAGIVNGISLFFLSTVLFPQFKFLPLPVVAAILCNTAYRMLEVEEIKLLARTDPAMFTVAVVTALICIIEDPTMGIVYGTGLAMIRSLLAMLHGHAILQVYKGTRCELQWHFTLNDHATQLRLCRSAFTTEPDAETLAAEKALRAAEIASASTVLAQATMTLKKAREGAKAAVAASVKKMLASVEFEIDRGANPEGHFTAVAEADVDEHVSRVAFYSIAGYFTYISAQSHLDRIRGLFLHKATSLPGLDVIAISLADCHYADPDAMDAMGDLVSVRAPHPALSLCRALALTPSLPSPQDLVRHKMTVFMVGFQPGVRRMFNMQHWSHGLTTFPDYGSLLVHMREVASLEMEKGNAGGSLNDYVSARVEGAVQAQLQDAKAQAGAIAPRAPGPTPTQNRPSSTYRLLAGGAPAGSSSESFIRSAPLASLPESRTGSPAVSGEQREAFSPGQSGAGAVPAPLTHSVLVSGLASPTPVAGGNGAAGVGGLKSADDW